MNEIQMMTTPHYHILCKGVCMTFINEKEEHKLDKNIYIEINRGDKQFIITKDNIFCYGEVDFNNREDLQIIEDFNFVKDPIPYITRYDYNNHCSYSHNKKPLWSETTSSAQLAIFAHGCLGKPKRIVLFKF